MEIFEGRNLQVFFLLVVALAEYHTIKPTVKPRNSGMFGQPKPSHYCRVFHYFTSWRVKKYTFVNSKNLH